MSEATRTMSVTTPRRLPAAAGFVVVASALAAFFAAAGASSPLLPIYESRWGFAPWVLTLAFGIYALGLLLALLVVGSLSDHVGRRPLLIGALVVELASMVVFLLAPSVEWLLVARAVQGVATGAATSSFSAAIVELAPDRWKRLGSVLGSVSPSIGLGIGALLSGLVAQLTGSAAAGIVWGALVVVMTVGTVLAVLTPETSTRRPGALASLVPQVAVPTGQRRRFALTVPGEVAGWMTSALFLGLVPTVLRATFHVESPLLAGLASALALGAAGLVSWLAVGVPARTLALAGTIAVGAGAVMFVGSVALAVLPLLWAAAVVGGAGLGATLSGTIRDLVPDAHPHQRAGLFAAIFLVAYLAFGIPAIVAGLVIGAAGVTATVGVFGAVVVAAAVVGVVAQALARRGRRG
jgi:predicted MFS family arabinose efflux permease